MQEALKEEDLFSFAHQIAIGMVSIHEGLNLFYHKQ